MAGKPRGGFWLTVLVIVLGLMGYALYKSGIFKNTPPIEKAPEATAGASNPEIPSAGPAEVLDIEFHSSSAKKEWVDAMVGDFNRSQQKVGDKTIRIKAVHAISGDTLDGLVANRIKPVLWSPGDESWLEMAAAHWKKVKQRELFEKYTPLLNVPLVIAMWEPMARALGYPKPIGWSDIKELAVSPKGWATYKHPEWGRFRWGHAHPDANSGFLAIVSEVYAALGKVRGIDPNDLKNPKVVNFLQTMEGAVEHYGLSNDWIDELMHTHGPSYLSATVQYENTIIRSNEKYQNKPFKMLAIYPKEGCFWTRHPVAILQEAWVTPEMQQAAAVFVDFLLSESSQRKAMALGLRPILEKLQMESPFDADHGVVPNIVADRSFEVPDESVLKRIRDLWESVKVPATVAMLLDRSASMKGVPLDNAKAGAADFLKSMKPRDRVQLIFFNKELSSLSDFCAINTCGEDLLSRIDGVFAEGETSLHDAILKAYRDLQSAHKKDPLRRYAVLLLSDGQDTASQTNRNDFLDSLPTGEDYDAPKIFSIAYGPEADRNLLSEISNRTNGRLFVSTPEEIRKTYKELSANF